MNRIILLGIEDSPLPAASIFNLKTKLWLTPILPGKLSEISVEKLILTPGRLM
jgi:hypothetical protein